MERFGCKILSNASNLNIWIWFERAELYFSIDGKDITIARIDAKLNENCNCDCTLHDRIHHMRNGSIKRYMLYNVLELYCCLELYRVVLN